MRNKRKNLWKNLILAAACAVMAFCCLFFAQSVAPREDVSAYSTLPSTPTENLFFEDIKKFNLSAFDDLAAVLGYSKVEQMVSSYSAVKTAANFGTAVVNLGSYKAPNGTQRELTWIPTYLSKDKSGNVILTLWLANTANENTAATSYQEVSPFSDGTYHLSGTKTYYEPGSTTGQNVYSNTYDGSYIRHAMLNADSNYLKAWGQYFNGSTVTVSGTRVTMPDKSDLTKYTLFTTGELSKYIVSPVNVDWQMAESGYPNDPSHSEVANYPNNWTKDKIWLPSVTEAWDNHLWQTTKDQRKNSYTTFLRSAGPTDRARTTSFQGNAEPHQYDFVYDTTTWLCVRPAFHLNLTSVIANGIRPVTAPSDVTTVYNGRAQDVSTLISEGKTPAWYDTSKMSLSYSTSGMTDIGTYAATATLKMSDPKEAWRDGTTAAKPLNFTITEKPLTLKYTKNADNLYDVTIDTTTVAPYDPAPPTDIALKVVYTKKGSSAAVTLPLATNGDYTVRATLPGFPNYTVSNPTYDFSFTRPTVAIPRISTASQEYEAQPIAFAVSLDANEADIDATGSGATWDPATRMLTATEVGKYTVKAKLKHPAEKDWVGGTTLDQDIPFEITKATANVFVTDDKGSTTLTCGRGSTPNLTVSVGTLKSDALKLDIYAVKGTDEFLLAGNVLVNTPNAAGTGKTATVAINTMALQVDNTYTVDVKYTSLADEKNGSYNLNFINKPTLAITRPEKKVNVLWTMTHGSVNGTHAAGDTASVTYGETLTYDGTPFVWAVDVPTLMFSDYALDTTYGSGGYQNAQNTDAGTYTTSVKIVSTDGGADPGVFEITWTVDPAKFDLAQMTWKGNGELEFNNRQQTMELENVPAVLKVNYGGIPRWKDVKDPVGTVSVTSFSFADASQAKNYVLPLKGDTSTYENTDGAFEWEIDWKIVPKKIRVDWGTERLTDTQGYVYDVAALLNADDRGFVSHTYYEVDASGNKLDPSNPVDIHTVTVPKKDVRYFICELELADKSGDYELVGDRTTSNIFMIGRLETDVMFELKSAKVAYTGKEVKLTFTNNGNLRTSDYTLKYYLGDGTPLDTPPTDVGKYRVEVVLTDEAAQDFYIASASDFAFEILGRQIAENWIESVKPPRLNINRTEAEMLEYRFADASGNAVTFEEMKNKAGKYQVQAAVKEEYRVSCTFTSGSAFTDWKEFTLTDADLANLEDPNDPNYYDEEGDGPINPDPGDNNGGNTGGDQTNGENMPLWQFCVGGASILLALVFLAKGTKNRRERKDAEKQIEKFEKKRETAYAAMGLLLGMEETFWGISGLWWTVIAASLAAVCLAALAFMVITGKSKKKALAALDEAEADAEEAERVAAEQKEEKRLEQEQRRREEEQIAREEQRRLDDQRREEERQRHEEEMKMLVMMMNNGGAGTARGGAVGGSGPVNTIDTTAEEMVTRVVTALIPMIQQALPAGGGSTDPALVEELRNAREDQRLMLEEFRRDREDQRALIAELLRRDEPRYAVTEPVYMGEATDAEGNQTVIHVHGSEGNDEALAEIRREQAAQKEMLEKLLRASEDKTAPEPQAVIVDNSNDEALEAMRREREELRKQQAEQNALLEKLLRATEEKNAEPEPEPQVVYVTPEATEEPAIERPEIVRLTYAEAYAALEDEKKTLLNDLRDYAVVKSGSTSSEAKYHMTVGSGAKQVLKVVIKDGVPIAGFRVEDARLRELRRASGRTEVKIKETQVSIDTHEALEMAKNLIDLRTVQIEEDVERRKEEQKQKRKEKNKQK